MGWANFFTCSASFALKSGICTVLGPETTCRCTHVHAFCKLSACFHSQTFFFFWKTPIWLRCRIMKCEIQLHQRKKRKKGMKSWTFFLSSCCVLHHHFSRFAAQWVELIWTLYCFWRTCDLIAWLLFAQLEGPVRKDNRVGVWRCCGHQTRIPRSVSYSTFCFVGSLSISWGENSS